MARDRAAALRHASPGRGVHRRWGIRATNGSSPSASVGAAELFLRVDGSSLDVLRGDGPSDLAFATGPDIRRLISGELAPKQAIATGVVEVLRGSGGLLDRFADTFHLAA